MLSIRVWALFIVALFSISAPALAQKGQIAGTISDSRTNEPIIGANVIIQGTTTGTMTDFDGNFELANVNPGEIVLQISFISYKKMEVPVTVLAGQTARLQIKLEEDVEELKAVEVVTERITHTEKAVVMEIRQSKQIVTGISSQEIGRLPDKDAAQVVSRVPGVTIVDNSFVMIRGLSQRYNSVQINGVSAPSTEPDSRSFAFDLLPSTVLDRMMIYKSGSADLPGDFAGGVIKVYTRGSADQDVTEFSIGTGMRVGTHFKTYEVNRGSGTDFLGFDSGKRALPNDFPEDLQTLNSEERKEAGRMLSNNFGLEEQWVGPDAKMGLNLIRNFKIKNTQVGSLNSLNYGYSSQFLTVQRNRYSEDRATMFDFEDSQLEREARVGLISNWNFRINSGTKISFRNTLNQIGESATIIRTGMQPQERQNDVYRNLSYQYLSRTIYSSQLEGKHELNNQRTEASWVLGFSYVGRNEPDYRRFRSTRPLGSDGPFTLIDPPGATTFDNARFFSHLNEYMVSQGTSFDHKLGKNYTDKDAPLLRFGYYTDYKTRSFRARWMSYTYPSFGDPVVKQQLVVLPIDEVFAPENIDVTDGWRLQEGTNPSDRYDARSFTGAAYLGTVFPVGKFNISAGIRGELFLQQLESATNNEDIFVNNLNINPLPFANIAYNLGEKMILRLAYGLTVNRPEFRELAPFLYYNFKYDVNYVGEPNLKTANIHNLDLRYEWYPRTGETISFGLFYKYFRNPIENYVQAIALSQQFKMGNAPSAFNYGAEVEIRRALATRENSKLLSRVYLIGNAAYIVTQVDLGEGENLAQERKRQLQGQSPYVVNMGVHYQDQDNGFNFSILYNVFGQRIFFVGNNQFPTVYEMPRHVLDLTISKRFAERSELKLNVSDLLNYPVQLIQDSNRDGVINAQQDDHIMKFRRGTGIGLSYSYRF